MQHSIHEVMCHPAPELRTDTAHLPPSAHRSPVHTVFPWLPSSRYRELWMCVHPHLSLTHRLTPCTQRQPDRGRGGPGGGPAGAGPGQQPSAAEGPARHFSGPTAHTPTRSGWTQQRGDSLSELPGCREGTESMLVSLYKVSCGQLYLVT